MNVGYDALNVQLDLNSLAEFIFMKNAHDSRVYLQLDKLQTPKDLFCFFVHLLCKGFVLLFGDGHRYEMWNLSIEHFDMVKRKLRNIGVVCHAAISQEGDPRVAYVDMDDMTNTSITKLEDHKIRIQTHGFRYVLHFSVVHD